MLGIANHPAVVREHHLIATVVVHQARGRYYIADRTHLVIEPVSDVHVAHRRPAVRRAPGHFEIEGFAVLLGDAEISKCDRPFT